MPVRLPGSESLGARPTPQPTRGVVGYEGGAVGRATEQLGHVTTQVADEYQKEADAQAVFAARRQLDDWERTALYDPEKGAASKKGADAFQLPKTLPAEFDEAAGKIGEGLANPRQKFAYQQMAASRRDQITGWADRYTLQQKEVYDNGQYEADVKSFADRAALFPEKAGGEIALMKARTIGFMRGKGKSEEEINATLKDQTSMVHSVAISSMLNAGNADAAQSYFEANKSGMTAEATLRAEAGLKEVVARSKAQAFGDEIMGKGLTLDQALDAARTKFSGKDEDAAVQEVKTRYTEREVVHSRLEKENSDTAWKVIAAGGSRKQIPPNVWNALDGKEQAQINDYVDAKWRRAQADAKADTKEAKLETDMGVYYGLRRMAVDEPESFAKVDLMKSQPYLKDNDLKHLMELQAGISKGDMKTIDSQKTVKRTIDMVKSSITAAGIDLTPKEGTAKAKETEAFMGSITRALDEATAVKGKPLTDEEARKIGMGMLREEYEQNSGVFGLFVNKKRGYQINAEDRGKYVTKRYADIPVDIREEILNDLYPKGRGQYDQIDKARVERVYERAVQAGRIK